MMNEASLAQNDAAEPDGSVWLSANAGSGKTKVLIDRVARLLLRGTPPQRILCLTYTKAAASEMQNRLFQRLGSWAMLPDAALVQALSEMGEAPRDADLLLRARRLFARAIETPGGLKIQTIHAFCSSLLRRFPLEAGVSPDFAEVDDRSLAQLRLTVLDRVARGPASSAMLALMRRLDEGSFANLLRDIGKHRDAFLGPQPNLARLFGLPPTLTEEALVAQVFLGDEMALIARLLPILAVGGAKDTSLRRKLAQVSGPGLPGLVQLEGALLTKTGESPFTAKTGTHVSKPTSATVARADLMALDELGERVESARDLRLGLESQRMTRALHDFARLWIPLLDTAKLQRGWLDFDDLIRLAGQLLGSSAVAQWVLFKLDGGIDHILIDEAQDTSPDQWRVIDLLTQEFTAGQGARDDRRTIFVVGDRKQSIYSFQGADLHGFESALGRFSDRLEAVGEGLTKLELRHSFRSSDAVLRLVDLCFSEAAGPGGLGGAPQHLAFRPEMPGRVDLWPALEKLSKPKETPWDSPLDRPAPDDPEVRLANGIAAQLRAMIDRGEQIPTKSGARPMHEGDVLILVRRRGVLFNALIRSCKAEGLAIAGADRLQLGSELAVQDLIALLRFLALPEDDLSLAVALRSPLFGLSEDDLFRLAHGRPGFLWSALKSDPRHAETCDILQDLRDQVDFLRPYELLERCLTRHDGRRRIKARFENEVAEAVEAFVELALAYEAENVPTLDGFLCWVEASDAEVKRQSEAGGRRLRVMTVHGAKGLEAPVVILPDTDARPAPRPDAILVAGGVPMLRALKDEATAAQREADAMQAGLRDAENDRLLYVALTRAESWLIVAGTGKTDKAESWYARVCGAFDGLSPVPLETPFGVGLRHAHGVWPQPDPKPSPTDAPAERVNLPPLPMLRAPLQPLTPTVLGGAKALAGAGDESADALARGTLIHALLESLPLARNRESAAAHILQDAPGGAEILAEVEAVLRDAALAPLFAAEAGVEVTLSAEWRGRTMWGVIDRMLVSPERILAVDFKSNRTIPKSAAEVPEGLLRQMGAYAHMLAQVFPGRRIDTALVWTRNRQMMILDPELTSAALERAALDPAVWRP